MGTPAAGPHFIGPAWNPDGQPLLVESLDGRKGRSRQRHLQRTILVVDDFGNAVAYLRCCPECWEFQPLQFSNFQAHRNGTLGMNSRCSQCSVMNNIQVRRKNPERHRAGMRRRYKERMQDPAYAEYIKNKSRASYERRKALKGDEILAAQRESARRYRERLKQDPERLARFREARRLANRLKVERRTGTPVTELRQGGLREATPHDINERMNTLPGQQLARVVRKVAMVEDESLESICARVGVADRAIRRWEEGEGVAIRSADAIMTTLKLAWWEVWTPDDPEAHERARQVFEADDLTRRAAA